MTDGNLLGDLDLQRLLGDLLRRQLTAATSADVAFQKGIDEGIRLAMQRADDAASLERFDRILATVERVAEKVFARDLKALAQEKPPEKQRPSMAEVMRFVAKEPPAAEAASMIIDAGGDAEAWPVILDHVREASADWRAWVDAHTDYLATVEKALRATSNGHAAPAADDGAPEAAA